jgi:hypothetical protein
LRCDIGDAIDSEIHCDSVGYDLLDVVEVNLNNCGKQSGFVTSLLLTRLDLPNKQYWFDPHVPGRAEATWGYVSTFVLSLAASILLDCYAPHLTF